MIVQNNQNIFDIAMQEFGTLNEAFRMINDNDLTFNSKLRSSQELVINNEGVGDNNVKNFVILQKVKFTNDQGISVPPLVSGDYSNDYSNDYY